MSPQEKRMERLIERLKLHQKELEKEFPEAKFKITRWRNDVRLAVYLNPDKVKE